MSPGTFSLNDILFEAFLSFLGDKSSNRDHVHNLPSLSLPLSRLSGSSTPARRRNMLHREVTLCNFRPPPSVPLHPDPLNPLFALQTTPPGLGGATACRRTAWTRAPWASITRGKPRSTTPRKVRLGSTETHETSHYRSSGRRFHPKPLALHL